MEPQHKFEGATLAEVLAKVHAEYGSDAKIASAQRVRSGGVMGFFQREKFEVLASPAPEPPPTSPTVETVPAVVESPTSLLDLAERVNQTERTHETAIPAADTEFATVMQRSAAMVTEEQNINDNHARVLPRDSGVDEKQEELLDIENTEIVNTNSRFYRAPLVTPATDEGSELVFDMHPANIEGDDSQDESEFIDELDDQEELDELEDEYEDEYEDELEDELEYEDLGDETDEDLEDETNEDLGDETDEDLEDETPEHAEIEVQAETDEDNLDDINEPEDLDELEEEPEDLDELEEEPALPVDDTQLSCTTYRSLGLPDWLAPESEAQLEATLQHLLPSPPQIEARRGSIICIVGERELATQAAERYASTMRNAQIVFSSRTARTKKSQTPLRESQHAQDAHRSWRRRHNPTIVVIEAPPMSQECAWADEMLTAFEPLATYGVVEAWRKPEDVAAWSEAIGGIDALIVHNIAETTTPASILSTNIPVMQIDDVLSSPSVWTQLLENRLSHD